MWPNAEQRFQDALINYYKQYATFGTDSESLSRNVSLLSRAAVAAREYEHSKHQRTCIDDVIAPTKELLDAGLAIYSETLNGVFSDISAERYEKALGAWQTAIAVCPQAVNPYLLQGNP